MVTMQPYAFSTLFLYLHVGSRTLFVHTKRKFRIISKIMINRDDCNFDVNNYPFLDGNISKGQSYRGAGLLSGGLLSVGL